MGENIEAVDARFKIIAENLRLAMCAAPELDMAFEPELFGFTPDHLDVLQSDLAELRASLAAIGSIAHSSDEIKLLKQLVKKLQEDCLRAQEDRVSALLECAKLQKERNDVCRDAIEKIEALRKENRRLKLDLANLKHKQDKEVEKGNKNRIGKEGRSKKRTCTPIGKAAATSLSPNLGSR
ncbi:hypothetical protein BO79DRAFT_152545 [Aspergillus costaricaensis CBS 115574]|uniref:Uncharacterized protein n=1 Tax=Aspergillus costaricaensis CBS 115574 TaxID=1448317 RepID=A0ACD1I8F1_9EURO|nr:hypothetical protein BO79DRAFT_152545 [Aspergillus costaricaensis CBS 115574]RAK86779.1 hypothetical protein BO79DRAFT_152545 [Aspergillus costaricaensis CBS 115574]